VVVYCIQGVSSVQLSRQMTVQSRTLSVTGSRTTQCSSYTMHCVGVTVTPFVTAILLSITNYLQSRCGLDTSLICDLILHVQIDLLVCILGLCAPRAGDSFTDQVLFFILFSWLNTEIVRGLTMKFANSSR